MNLNYNFKNSRYYECSDPLTVNDYVIIKGHKSTLIFFKDTNENLCFINRNYFNNYLRDIGIKKEYLKLVKSIDYEANVLGYTLVNIVLKKRKLNYLKRLKNENSLKSR